MSEDARPSSLRVTLGLHGECIVVRTAGELDASTVGVLRGAVAEAISQRFSCLIVDLTELAFCDSAGLAVLIQADRLIRAEGGHMILTGVPSSSMRMLSLTGLDGLFDLRDSAEVAIEQGVSGGQIRRE